MEFLAALAAECRIPNQDSLSIDFVNALNYTGQSYMEPNQIEHFNEAMQFLTISKKDCDVVSRQATIQAIQRCSLVHALYEVIAIGNDYQELAEIAIADGGFDDMYKGGLNENDTWCFRVRNFGDLATTMDKEKRYGARARSLSMEQEGLKALKGLLIRFGGKVDLRNPDCKIYVFDGLHNSKKVLTRRIAVSPKVRMRDIPP